MKHSLSDRCMALAGMFQAAELVQQEANARNIDRTALQSVLNSVFLIDADDVATVYGGSIGLRMGLNALCNHLTAKPDPAGLEVLRYVINLLHLERKLTRRKDLLSTLQQGIQQARPTTASFSPDRQEVVSALAALYQRTISTLTPRIMVQGDPGVLADPVQTDLIRALLLGGIRSAVLWRQCGGGRILLWLHRRAILQEADRLLREE